MTSFRIFTAITVCAVLATACEKEPQVSEAQSAMENSTQISTRVGDASMLSFESEEKMHQQIDILQDMAPEKMSEWYEQNDNFTSQSEFMWQVVDELNNAASVDEVREIQAKYQGILLFNNNSADEDIAPYIPSECRGTELVCNKNGDVLIAGKVKNYNSLTSYEQTSDYAFNHPTKTRASQKLAGVYAIDGKRKFWCEAMLDTNSGWISLQFTAHAKNIFGWNKYKTSYGIKVMEFVNWASITNFTVDLLNARPNYYVTREMKSGTSLRFAAGRLNPSMVAKFYIVVYSRGVGAANAKGFGVFNSPTPLRSLEEGYYQLNSEMIVAK